MARVEVWCDGSGTMRGPMGWAAVLLAINPDTGEVLKQVESIGWAREGTSQRAELCALAEGLSLLSKPTALTIISDSEYTINCFRKGWAESWALNDWKRNTPPTNGSKLPDGPLMQCPMCGRIEAASYSERICYRHEPMGVPFTPGASKRMVRNRDLLEQIMLLVRPHTIRWEHRRGHQDGDYPMNDLCDDLAGSARRAAMETV